MAKVAQPVRAGLHFGCVPQCVQRQRDADVLFCINSGDRWKFWPQILAPFSSRYPSLFCPPPSKHSGQVVIKGVGGISDQMLLQITLFCKAAASLFHCSGLFFLSLFPVTVHTSHVLCLSHRDEQKLPRDRFYINNYRLLTANEALLSDQ